MTTYGDGYDDNPLIDWIVKSVNTATTGSWTVEEALDRWLDGKGTLTDRERAAVITRLSTVEVAPD